MKFLIIIGTLGLATFVVLKRRRPELAERVESAVKDAAEPRARAGPGRHRREPARQGQERREMTDTEHDEDAPGGMEAIEGEPVTDSDDPGGMSGIPDPDPDADDHRKD